MTRSRRRGDSIGPYRLEVPLGRGAMGEVWRASGPTGPVALKLLLLLHDQGATARFVREAKLGAQLDHPNLVAVKDVGEHEGRPYLAMELIDGTTLADLLWRGGRMAPNLLLDLGRQLAAGVDALHEADLVHRDLKPGNVMVTRRGVVKVADLGLIGGDSLDTLTRTGTVVGTPRFMAPEQVREGRATASSDIYAMALMLYLALTGRDPFGRTKDTSLGETLQRLVTEAPQPWHASRAGGPLDRVFQAALSRDQAARPTSGEALIEAMGAAIDKERSGSGEVQDPSTELLDVDPTDTLELAAAEAPRRPREIDEPASQDAPAPAEPGASAVNPRGAARIGPGPWLGLGLVGALLGAVVWPRRAAPQVTAWAVFEGNRGAALVFHTDAPVALAGGPADASTAHVVPWTEAGISPRTAGEVALFATPPQASPEPIGSGQLGYDEAGAILLRFRAPTLGDLRIESGVHVWRPTPQGTPGTGELVFRLPGGDITEPLSVLLEAGDRAVELARLVPPPPASEARSAALERLAAWDPRQLLEGATTGDHSRVVRELLGQPTVIDYLAIEANLVHTMERRPNYTPSGLDRILLVDAYLHHAKVESPIRLARSSVRTRVWRHGFWPLPIPRYDGLVVYHGQGKFFSYDFEGAAGSTDDPAGLIAAPFGSRPLRAPELPPGPCWLEVYINVWRGMTYAALWIDDAGPYFVAERPRANPALDLEVHRARATGPFRQPAPDHRILRVRLPAGVVSPDDPLAAGKKAGNTLRVELRSWAGPSDIKTPWAFLHAYGVRPLDAIPIPPEPQPGR